MCQHQVARRHMRQNGPHAAAVAAALVVKLQYPSTHLHMPQDSAQVLMSASIWSLTSSDSWACSWHQAQPGRQLWHSL